MACFPSMTMKKSRVKLKRRTVRELATEAFEIAHDIRWHAGWHGDTETLCMRAKQKLINKNQALHVVQTYYERRAVKLRNSVASYKGTSLTLKGTLAEVIYGRTHRKLNKLTVQYVFLWKITACAERELRQVQ